MPDPRYLSSSRIAEIFGVSIWTAIRWIRAGTFGPYHSKLRTVGASLRVPAAQVQAFIERGTVPVLTLDDMLARPGRKPKALNVIPFRAATEQG